MKLAGVLVSLILILSASGALIYFKGPNLFLGFQNNNASPSLSKGGPITKPPATFALNLDSPDNNLLVFNKNLIISGNTNPNASVLISTLSNDSVITSKPDGTFSTDLTLDPGENNLKVVVFDKNGDSRSQERTIYYSKDKI